MVMGLAVGVLRRGMGLRLLLGFRADWVMGTGLSSPLVVGTGSRWESALGSVLA